MAVWMYVDYFSVTWTLAIGAILLFLVYDWWCHHFFQRAGIPVAPYYPIVGNGIQWLLKGSTNLAEECVQKYGKVVGIYRIRQPILIVTDPDIVKKVFVTDFNKFPHRWKVPAIGFPLSSTLVYMTGQKSKDVRAMITPFFTTTKLKQMVSVFNECCDPLLDNLQNAHTQNKPLECKKVFLGFFIQATVSVVLGLDVPCQTNLDHPFLTKAEKAFQPSLITAIPSPLFEFFGANIFSRDAIKLFTKAIKDKVELNLTIRSEHQANSPQRLPTLAELCFKHTDIPDYERTEETPAKDSDTPKKLSYKEFIAQSALMLLGGNEATSTFLICTAYQLALSPEIQNKLIAEVDKFAATPEDITYAAMDKMTYMEMVFMESFRMYPAEILADRECVETVKYGNYTLKKGIIVNIPFYPIQHDEEIWPDPEKFIPERFSPENKGSNNPMGWVVFGGGPRMCVAVKFVILIAKVFFTRVLQKYLLETCPETPIPLKFKKMTMLEPDNVYVRVIPRKNV